MVGVPGRSKACHNCRQRRIKCTGERPVCQNCAKSSRLCAGYARNHAIVLSKEMFAGQEGRTSAMASASGHEDAAAVSVHIGRWRADRTKANITTVRTPVSHTRINPGYYPICIQLDPRSAYREQFYSLFLPPTFPTICHPNVAAVENNWLLDVLHLPALSPALDNATLAVCAARLGKRDGKPTLVQQSLALYTQGLHNFSKEICDPSNPQNEQALAAGMLMLMYEVSECPGGTPEAYQQHYKGIMSLLELRGPEAHRHGLAHSVFRSLRVHSMFQAFVHQSKAKFSEQRWRDVPFTESKDYFDQLLDILFEITGFFPQRQRIENMTDPRSIFRETLATIREGLRIEHVIADWYARFKETVSGPLYYPELSKREYMVDQSDLGKMFPVAFRFPSFSVAQNLLFYWVALLSLHAHLGWVYGTLSRLLEALELIRVGLPCTCDSECLRHFTMDDLPALGDRLDWPRTTAYNICQSIEYCLQDHGRGFGPVAILPVLSMVKGYWVHWPGDWSREIEWVDENFSLLGRERSIIARHLR